MKKSNWLFIILNTVLALISSLIVTNKIIFDTSLPLFELLIIPFLFIFLNGLLAWGTRTVFTNFFSIATGGLIMYITIRAFNLLILKRPQELPPGEIILGADLIMIVIISFIQLCVFFVSFIIVYMAIKIKNVLYGYSKKDHSI